MPSKLAQIISRLLVNAVSLVFAMVVKTNKSRSYLIDEKENPSEGAGCIISLVHHYLEHHGAGEKNVYLHADNCVGQNTNNTTIQYLMWRVITGRHESAELLFMLVGHTKFSPDCFFGIFKKAFRRTKVCTLVM